MYSNIVIFDQAEFCQGVPMVYPGQHIASTLIYNNRNFYLCKESVIQMTVLKVFAAFQVRSLFRLFGLMSIMYYISLIHPRSPGVFVYMLL